MAKSATQGRSTFEQSIVSAALRGAAMACRLAD